MACVVLAPSKGETSEVVEAKSKTTTITTDNEAGASSVCTPNVPRDEQEMDLNGECKAVGDVLSGEQPVMPGVAFSPREHVTPNLVISNNKEAGGEFIIDTGFGASEVKDSGEQIRQQGDNFFSENLDNGDNSDIDKTRVENVNEYCDDDNDDVESTNSIENIYPLVDNNLEENPVLLYNVMETADRNNVMQVNEERPVIFCDVPKNRDTQGTEDKPDQSSEADDLSCPTRYDGSQTATCPSLTRNYSVENTEEKPTAIWTKILEAEQKPGAPTRNEDCFPKETGECNNFQAAAFTFRRKAESTEEEKKEIFAQKGENSSSLTRSRAFTERPLSSDRYHESRDISVVLHSRSLDNLRLYHQQEGAGRSLRPSRATHSPPVNSHSSVGHLSREKRPTRRLRRTTFDVVRTTQH